ncbi:hypothetical protein GGX14DRAFT_343711 [Mycena pura]|uniref:Alpha-type protein kinase domain-containing protein n=1 Tax=Mycena pura TaxID=153505 RepID=A0AAD6YVG3_9AGAR|nr:hypothetical protein GGX14DRAFT_343711 [Mycena pura]
MLGKGRFKTVQVGYLSLSHIRPDGLRTKENERVAVKRPFVTSEVPSSSTPQIVTRFTSNDEHSKFLVKANILLWSASLWAFTLSYITHMTSQLGKPPFQVPDICFVHAGLAIFRTSTSYDSAVVNTFLIEELLDTSNSGFTKFINNGSAQPVDTAMLAHPDICMFLTFTQHLQYWKSGGAIFLSDLQGTTSVLTDSQILTNPSFAARGMELFGDGNVPQALENFPLEHHCNRFCI